MIARLLACVVAQAGGMGLLHLALGRRGPFPVAIFCALSGGLGTVLGLAAMGPPLLDHARLSPWTVTWLPAFALGFFASGVVVGAGWVTLVRGGDLWLRGRMERRRQ